MSAPLPSQEIKRVLTLQDYKILDTPSEIAFDHVTTVAARHFETPIAMVTFIDADRQWVKSCFGANMSEGDRKLSFCAHAILSSRVMTVKDASADPRFSNHPLVTGEPHIRFYAGAPLRTAKGQNLGTLCIMDKVPRQFDSQERLMLRNLALIVMDQLNVRRMAWEHRELERERRVDLAKSQIEILQRLARAAEYRDDETGRHTQRVAHTSALIAKALHFSREQITMIQQAAPLHDVGKISISDLILLKPGPLTLEEYTTMKTHTSIGAKLLAEGKSAVVQMAERIAGSHHERWDGKGYPQGLTGEAIPIEARILAVADVFDALTHERPYKAAWPIEAAVMEIKCQSGCQFDPRVVNAFLTLDHKRLV